MKRHLHEQRQESRVVSPKKETKSRIRFIEILILTLIITVCIGIFFRETDAIYIAVAGPMSGEASFKGEELVRTTQLYVDEVNEAGGVNGKKLKLLIFDDEGRPELAREKAQEIVEKTPAIAVIGHVFSNSSIAAQEIYDRSGIAAITATANADELTEGNKSYFRLGASASTEGSFLANYLHSILQVSTASAIYDAGDPFSTSLIKGFTEAFNALEGEIEYEWNVKDFGVNPEEQYEQITRELLNNKDKEPGTIVVALQSKNAVDFIVALRRKGFNSPIIGGDNLGGEEVANLFYFYPEERAKPGYFSNDILAAVPIVFDLADEEAQELTNEYWEKYNLKSGWRTAAHYDTTKVLVEAIKNANIEGSRKNISEQRLLVRESLASFDNQKNAIKGLLGTLYFDEEGNAGTTLSMGMFENQKFISAFTQLSPIPDIRTVKNLDDKLATEEIIIANDRYQQKINVVYTGLDLNEIINLDEKTSSYTADFYLWFRYKGEIDASNIEFTNYSVERLDSGEKLELGEPIEINTVDGMTYELYRVKADFKEEFLFYNYPFDRQKISVRFRHADKTRENFIYVVDVVGLQDISSEGILNKLKKSQVFSTITDWKIESAEIFQDTVKDNSTLGKKEFFNTDAQLEYSRFNLEVYIKRKFLIFTLKNLLPLLFFLLVSYLLLFLPFEDISVEGFSGVLLAVVFFHLSLLEALPDGVGYMVALDYAFYIIYGLLILQMVMVVVGKKRIFEQSKTKLKQLIKASRAIYLVLLAIAILGFGIRYELIKLESNSSNESIASLSSTSLATETMREKVTLKLGYVFSDYQTQMKQVLAEFNAKSPRVEVELVPVNLAVNLDSENPLDNNTLLRSLLKQGAATDLLLVEPFTRGKELFITGDLKTLGTTSEFNNFLPSALTAWSTKNGKLYALPLFGTAHGIYYNTEIFQELNLQVPTTWEDLQETAEILQDNGYIPFANSSTNGQMLMDEMFLNILPNFIGGARGMQEYLRGDRCLNDEGVVAAFAAIADLEPFLATSQQASNYYDSLNLFARGKAAMWFGSSGSVPLLNSYAREGEWSVFAMPSPAGQQEYVRFTPELGVAINANSPHSQQAREFIEWLSAKEAALSMARELPGLFPLTAMESVKGDTGASAFIELMEKNPMLDSAWGLETLDRGLPDGYSLMKRGVVGVALGDRTPSEAADNLQKGLAKWFKSAKICRK